jgi:uncharacterized protein DUF2252
MRTNSSAAMLCAMTCAVWIAVGTAQVAPTDRPFGERASFRLEKATLRANGAPPALVESVSANAYRYFRMLARQFAARTCFEFRDLRWRLPSVAVHGDPHIEQFVTTDESYGLEDFDMAGYGPAVVDLVRYAASIQVACSQLRWSCNAEEAVDAYFAAYRAALEQPVARRQPGIVNRLRAAGAQDSRAWLKSVESLMQPIPAADEKTMRLEWDRFVHLMHETYPDRPETFYRIARAGRLQIGVGSALEAKVLIRIAGLTDDPDDDVILEARSSYTPEGSECVARPTTGGSLHVLLFASLLGPRLPDVFGFVPREGAREAPEIWIQSWDRGYRELSISFLQSQAELNELAVDAATQLAGHFWTKFPEPLRGHQRFAQLRAFEMTDARARQAAREFAREAMAEWERFRRQP